MYQEAPVISNNFQGGFDAEQNDDHVQNSTMKNADKTSTLAENGEAQQENLEEEQEIRKRQYSPRMTLPIQRKKEKEPDEAEGAARRISPKFRGKVGKFSEKVEEEKMYLFDLT